MHSRLLSNGAFSPSPLHGTLHHGLVTEISSQQILICLHGIAVNPSKQGIAQREDVSQKFFKSVSLKVFGWYKCLNKAD